MCSGTLMGAKVMESPPAPTKATRGSLLLAGLCLTPGASCLQWHVRGPATPLHLPYPCQGSVCTHQLSVLTQKAVLVGAGMEAGAVVQPMG